MDSAKRGADALAAGRYADAVEEYTKAIKSFPTSPDYYIKRSTAYQRLSPADFTSALADADTAVIFAHDRGKRELILQAQLRRGIALFGLERYADAKFVLDIVKRMDPKEKSNGMWAAKSELKMKELDELHAGNKVTVTEIPKLDVEKVVQEQSNTAAASTVTSNAAQAPTVAQTPANKIRHDFYENDNSLVFTLLAKGVPKEDAVIDIQERSLSISFPLATGSTYEFSLDPLYGPVDVSQSSFKVMSTKVEVTLRKARPGKWHTLEGNAADEAAESAKPVTSRPAPAVEKAPAYPTSSRSGPKNWDKLATDLTTKKPKKEGEAGKEDDDEFDYDKEDGDEVNGFFKKLYAGADPDTRRAMMKSYTESNGTALSTNWGDVGSRTVPTEAPSGMEAKSWN